MNIYNQSNSVSFGMAVKLKNKSVIKSFIKNDKNCKNPDKAVRKVHRDLTRLGKESEIAGVDVVIKGNEYTGVSSKVFDRGTGREIPNSFKWAHNRGFITSTDELVAENRRYVHNIYGRYLEPLELAGVRASVAVDSARDFANIKPEDGLLDEYK